MCMHYDDSRPTSEEYELLNEAEVIVGVRYRKQRIFKIQIDFYYLSIDVLGFPNLPVREPLIGMGLRLHKSRAPSSAASGLAARFQDRDTSMAK